MHACVTLIAFFRKSRRLHFHTKWVVVFFLFQIQLRSDKTGNAS